LLICLGQILTALITLPSDIFVIALTYGLGNALTKINKLENILLSKKVINENDKNIIENEIYVEPTTIESLHSNNEFSLCKKCGYQLFTEDKICPNCKTPKDKD